MRLFYKSINKYESSVRYLVTGGTAFIADYGILTTLHYYFMVRLFIAATAGFSTGFLISFLFNRKWVFGAVGSQRGAKRQLAEYVLLTILNYLFTIYALQYFETIGVTAWLGKILVMACITVWNYFLFKNVIFTRIKDI